MPIPDFLKRENQQKPSVKDIELMEAIDRYEMVIGEDVGTEPSSYSVQEWIDMLNECVEKHITIWELWGVEYDQDADY
jgi:hypothetical protein